MKKNMKVIDLTLIALFTAIMAVCSWIAIPAPVPFTLQTLGIFLTVGLLGGRRGTIAIAVYILLGAIGIPVFAGFTGGVGILISNVGGYVIGFLGSALLMWGMERIGAEKKTAVEEIMKPSDGKVQRAASGRRYWLLTLSMVLGLLVCYAIGTAWFMVVYTKTTGAVTLLTLLGWCVFPFVLPDCFKIAIAVLLTKRLKRFVPA